MFDVFAPHAEREKGWYEAVSEREPRGFLTGMTVLMGFIHQPAFVCEGVN